MTMSWRGKFSPRHNVPHSEERWVHLASQVSPRGTRVDDAVTHSHGAHRRRGRVWGEGTQSELDPVSERSNADRPVVAGRLLELRMWSVSLGGAVAMSRVSHALGSGRPGQRRQHDMVNGTSGPGGTAWGQGFQTVGGSSPEDMSTSTENLHASRTLSQ